MMPDAPGLPGGCSLSLEVEIDENELASERSISIDAEGGGGGEGGANVGCAIYRGISSNGASGPKKGLIMETAKECWKNMYNLPCAWPIKYMKPMA